MRKPHITAIGTAVPTYAIGQEFASEWIATTLALSAAEIRKVKLIYRATGIQNRYSVIPDFSDCGQRKLFSLTENLEPFPSTADRMRIYQSEAPLLAAAAVKNMGLPVDCFEQITHLITVSCTGMYAPGLDIDLIQLLGLPPSVQRTCIYFMGCYAAFNALQAATAICKAYPDAKVLIVDVELCTLHFQKINSEDQLLANAIFADGAASVLVECVRPEQGLLSLEGFYSGIIPESNKEMAWYIGNFGFEMKLSAYVPAILGNKIRPLIEQATQKWQIPFSVIDYFVFHPGGKRILTEIEMGLGISPHENRWAYEVMQQYGNMSSATIIFVLKHFLDSFRQQAQTEKKVYVLAAAFGPGLTMESAILQLQNTCCHYAAF
ncbi:MAG: type III polyketide synthase [Cytophagales bacterium]|nr:type III polyketide synthase [Bernardetiaceae bacterium]MDW8205566.1 type III polyketide synthase [Cytophagales bacterium]